jgi:hypothetical protein
MADRNGDIYDSSMGDDIKGATVELNRDDSGVDHHTVYGDGWHRSWDTDDNGNVTHDHVTTHDDRDHYQVNP